MSFKNPLNHWRGAELKAPILQEQALLAKKTRAFLLTHPQGSSEEEIRAALGDVGGSLHYLRKRKFARMMPWNKFENTKRVDVWFATDPSDPYWEERRKRLGY